jgi:uncharacterized protein YjiS (DUF1127 family)
MKTTTFDTAPAATGFFGHLVGAFRKISASIWEMHQVHVTHSELSALSDRELLDIGLMRSDIPAVAQGTFRRPSETAQAPATPAFAAEQDYRLAA